MINLRRFARECDLATDDDHFAFGLVAFFGRSIEEYVAMFNLDLDTLQDMSMLDCPAGPAAFARQGAERGMKIVACDPIYEQSDVDVLRQIVDETAESVARKQACDSALFHPELTPVSQRRQAMELFLQDYPQGRASGRYHPGRLPSLPFADGSFDIGLSGNFLFVYSDTNCGGIMENSPFDYEFHKKAVTELMRVCRKEVRIYPLRGPGSGQHVYLPLLMREFASQSLRVELQAVAQRDIIGAEQMLVILRDGH